MKVLIKKFDVSMEIKKSGVELEVRSPNGNKHYGDCYVSMTGLTWCEGRKSHKNGVSIKWADLQEICGSPEKLKTAIKAAKAL
jgi:hypothetical protein